MICARGHIDVQSRRTGDVKPRMMMCIRKTHDMHSERRFKQEEIVHVMYINRDA